MMLKTTLIVALVGSLGQTGTAFSLKRGNNSHFQSNNFAKLSRKRFLQVASAVAFGGTSFLLFPRLSNASVDVGGKIRFGDESIMSPKEHGTSAKPVQTELLYDVNNKLADKVSKHDGDDGCLTR